ncbi:MAG: type II toxin-antitoxin system RelE/ParE family toxin [Alphaproteobacteria bacterium]|nr:type II toxin-antitoxin system RelE/ParE family toxin [Alphaproteobacteria bacterium]MBF0130000.1 type II toxin-antitoxin system RelE/ParE family toxin [Alphaproteobacteria bacterium]
MDEILGFISQDNPVAARNLLAKMKGKFALLADNPGIGMSRNELEASLLALSIGNYLIFYRRHAGSIEIVRVLHGARDIAGLFD